MMFFLIYMCISLKKDSGIALILTPDVLKFSDEANGSSEGDIQTYMSKRQIYNIFQRNFSECCRITRKWCL